MDTDYQRELIKQTLVASLYILNRVEIFLTDLQKKVFQLTFSVCGLD